MRETHFEWPGRYAMWRADGVLCLSVTVGPAQKRYTHVLSPAAGYAFLMARRRTELLYAIAEAMAEAEALDDPRFAALVDTCAGDEEAALARLAEQWDGAGRVSAMLHELLGAAPAHWFAPVRRRPAG